MKYLIHGLGQSSSSWDNTISYMEDKIQLDCPNIFPLLNDKEPSHNNLYHSFSEYCGKSQNLFAYADFPLGLFLH
jgi:hypothetical protein